MSPKRRILLNIVASYGRSLYSMVLGLFTARWALNALGQTDYGLLGLVGGMVGMVSFLNSVLASSVGRFYAVSVGEAKREGNAERGLVLCRQWFNTALSIHTVLPLLLVAVGYPIGGWAICRFLSIPAERIADCMWVWRYSCITCFVGMISVPFYAMYTAKQEIAELTVFSVASTTANAAFLYYMVTHPGVWLARYSLGSCLIIAIPQIAILVRALAIYPECKIDCRYWFDLDKYKKLTKFAAAKFWADFAGLFSRQGQALLVNKYMGPQYNASMTIGNSVANQAATLSSSIANAFSPAIANLCGEGRMKEMRRFCFMTCRLGAVLLLLFAIPLILEINGVLHLWLGTPPSFTAEICVVILTLSVFEHMTAGYWMGIYGVGKGVVRYSCTVGWAGICVVAISWVCFICGLKMWSIVIGLSVAKCVVVITRLVFGKILVGLEISYWFKRVFAPIIIVAGVAFCMGWLVSAIMKPSTLRIFVTSAFSCGTMLPLAWFLVFDRQERNHVVQRIKARLIARNDD